MLACDRAGCGFEKPAGQLPEILEIIPPAPPEPAEEVEPEKPAVRRRAGRRLV